MVEKLSKKKRVYYIGVYISSMFFAFFRTIYVLLILNWIFLSDPLVKADFILTCICGVIFLFFLLLYIIINRKIRSKKIEEINGAGGTIGTHNHLCTEKRRKVISNSPPSLSNQKLSLHLPAPNIAIAV